MAWARLHAARDAMQQRAGTSLAAGEQVPHGCAAERGELGSALCIDVETESNRIAGPFVQCQYRRR